MERKKNLWRVIFVLALLGAIACAGSVGWHFYRSYQEERQMAQLQQEVTMTEEAQEPEPETVFVGEMDGEEVELPEDITKEEEVIPIDFARLQEINPELYAWIEIPGTVINYPIAQYEGQDQSYYLTHSMYGEKQSAGCIHTQNLNSKDFTDPNTVIYGHNMKNGSMFKGLHSFEDRTFFDENKYVYIYTPEQVLTYEIFAAYETDNYHLLVTYDFDDPEVFEKYLNYITGLESMYVNIRKDVEVDASDRIITLSTCVGGRPESRYLVQAVLLEDGEE